MPRKVFSRCHRSPNGYADHTTTDYIYDDDVVVTSDCSYGAAKSLQFDASARVFLERATVLVGTAYQSPITVYPEDGKPFAPKLAKRSGYEEEVRYFVSMIDGKVGATPRLTAEEARSAIALVLKEKQSAATNPPRVVSL